MPCQHLGKTVRQIFARPAHKPLVDQPSDAFTIRIVCQRHMQHIRLQADPFPDRMRHAKSACATEIADEIAVLKTLSDLRG